MAKIEIFQKLYDAIDNYEPSEETKESLTGGMKDILKKLLELVLEIVAKEFGKSDKPSE